MTAIVRGGPRKVSASRDAEGYRTYKVWHLVETDITDGPFNVINALGLPRPGDDWQFGSEIDPWAFCQPDAEWAPQQEVEGDPVTQWLVGQTFTNKPPDSTKQRCNDNPIDDPLLEPAKISGGGFNYQEEATIDRFGFPILTSSHEQLRGPQVEFDKNRPTISIEQNIPTFDGIVAAYAMLNTVNQFPLWGIASRCVKLSMVKWERKFYGRCYQYYTRTLEFDANSETFDRILLDEGSKVLSGRWTTFGTWQLVNINGQPPDPSNPQHFIRFQDRNGNVCRVILNGAGLPAEVQIGSGSTQTIPAESGPFYMSLTTDHGSGYDLANTLKWVRLITSPYRILDWGGGDVPRGTLASVPGSGPDAGTWVQVNSVGSSQIPGEGSDWIAVNVRVDRGAYVGNATYAVGDFVNAGRPSSVVGPNMALTGVGSVFVQKYTENDFLQLGIPAVL